jgi:hypothetical protein
MSSSRFGEKVDVRIGPSRQLGAALLAVHIGAAVWVALVTAPLWFTLLVSAALVASGWHAVARYVLMLRSDAITGVRCDSSNQWSVRFRSADIEPEPVTLLPTSYLHPQLVILNLRLTKNGRLRSVVLLRDNTDQDAFRRLRVRLLLAKAAFASSRPPAGISGTGAV